MEAVTAPRDRSLAAGPEAACSLEDALSVFPSERELALPHRVESNLVRRRPAPAAGREGQRVHAPGHRPPGVTIRVAKVSRGVAAGLAAILVVGAISVAGIAVVASGGRSAPAEEAAVSQARH